MDSKEQQVKSTESSPDKNYGRVRQSRRLQGLRPENEVWVPGATWSSWPAQQPEDLSNQMDQDLDKMECLVTLLKFTKDNLNSYYEHQLDQAHKEMLIFYNNLDNCDEDELSNTTTLFQDRNFFIKPTQVISLHL